MEPEGLRAQFWDVVCREVLARTRMYSNPVLSASLQVAWNGQLPVG
jgi:hypothetical protein